MTRRITCEHYAARAALVRADLWSSEGDSVMRFRRRRALAREQDTPDKSERHRKASYEFRQRGETA